jgi:hypothetical protein
MNNWKVLKTHDDGKYIVEEVVQERDDMPRGFFIGLRNVAAIWIATIAALAMIYALIKLPGLP